MQRNRNARCGFGNHRVLNKVFILSDAMDGNRAPPQRPCEIDRSPIGIPHPCLHGVGRATLSWCPSYSWLCVLSPAPALQPGTHGSSLLKICKDGHAAIYYPACISSTKGGE